MYASGGRVANATNPIVATSEDAAACMERLSIINTILSTGLMTYELNRSADHEMIKVMT